MYGPSFIPGVPIVVVVVVVVVVIVVVVVCEGVKCLL